MRQLLHACWPLVAVVAFTCVLALQIPRKALFFRPAAPTSAPTFAAFVEFDSKAYAKVMQQVRMSWQMRSQGSARTESPLAVLDLAEETPSPVPMELPSAFFSGRAAAAPRSDGAEVSLRPPTLAPPREGTVLAPPDDTEERRRLREGLLALPPSLQEPFENKSK